MLITLRMTAHAAASGYDRLADHLDGARIAPPGEWSLSQRVTARSLRFLIARSGSTWYHRGSLIGELNAAKLWLSRGRRVFHFLYGENSHRYLGLLKALRGGRNSIVCTYHTPKSRFNEVVRDRRHLGRLDAAVAVSTVQVEFLSEILSPDRVHYVPHGVDTDYFRPASEKPRDERLHCLFVGSHLRDFDTLAETARLLAPHRDIRLRIVTRPHHADRFRGFSNVDVFNRVDDGKLLELYQSSDLLLFPLLDCTANNSLLEAMACGVPILTTDLQGVRDYVSEECAVVLPIHDARAMADSVIDLQQDRARLAAMGRASRRRALELRWDAIAERMEHVYRGVCP